MLSVKKFLIQVHKFLRKTKPGIARLIRFGISKYLAIRDNYYYLATPFGTGCGKKSKTCVSTGGALHIMVGQEKSL